jgi:phage virion morphogenesis protein
MAAVVVKVDAARVTVTLQQFALSLSGKDELMNIIGLLMMRSVRQTFRDQGSPAGSWPPLSPNSLKWRKYSSGHKLLINTGLLLNSITFAAQGDTVVIGTGLSYAGVQQFGFDGTQSVKPYSYIRRQSSRDEFRKEAITNKLGHRQTVKRKVSSGIATVNVRAFSRHIRIPARPYLVFRPEDPARIQQATETWIGQSARQAGLEGN